MVKYCAEDIIETELAAESAEAGARARAAAFGFLVVLLPALGSGSVSALAALYLAAEKRRWQFRTMSWAAPLLLLLTAWLLCSLWFETIVWLPQWSPPDVSLFSAVLRLAVLVALFALFSDEKVLRGYALRGMFAALPLSAVVVFYQLDGGLAGILPNQTFYWDSLGRYSSTFSDPNAAGIFLILLLPFVLREISAAGRARLVLTLLILGSLLATAALSGSRSFLLGAALYLILLFYTHSKKATLALVVVLAAAVGSLDYARLNAADEYYSLISLAPPALQRLLESLSFLKFEETFASRFIFWRVAVEVWQDNPLFGVGYGRFADYVPYYAGQLGYGIGAWTDNANNFYLGLIAETGLLGLALLFLSLSRLRVKPPEPLEEGSGTELAGHFALTCLILLLLFGPHLNFDEVTVLAAIILASCVSSRELLLPRVTAVLAAAVVVCCVALKAARADYSFYTWEQDPDGNFFRWSAQHATGTLECAAGSALLKLRAANPNLTSEALRVHIRASGAENELVLSRPVPYEQPLACSGARRVRYWLQTSRSWKPSSYARTRDDRELGVQVLNSMDQVY